VRRAALLLAAALALSVSACGKDAADSPGSGAAASMTITVTSDQGATPKTYDLTCEPAGGNHPQPEQACAALVKAGVGIFDPVPKDRACTMIYGGPQKATVKGAWHGKRIDSSFNRSNGCEIARWETLGTTFFDVPLQ
jgi:hypothetical protein